MKKALYTSLLFGFVFSSLRSAAMPFELTDNPSSWGCKNLLIRVSGGRAELIIPPTAVMELGRVPWERHLEKTVHLHLPAEGTIHVAPHAIPFHIESLGTFSISAIDPNRDINKKLSDLRLSSTQDKRKYWQILVSAGNPRRAIWLPRMEFSNTEQFTASLEKELLPIFQSGGALQRGEPFNVLVLSSDSLDGAPPSVAELSHLRAIYNFAMERAGGNAAAPRSRLVTILKASSTNTFPDLLFIHDPAEDDARQWAVQ